MGCRLRSLGWRGLFFVVGRTPCCIEKGPSWAAVAAKAQTLPLFDMDQNNHICALPAVGGAVGEDTQTTWADMHRSAQALDPLQAFSNQPEIPRGLLPKGRLICSTNRNKLGADLWSLSRLDRLPSRD